MYATKFITDPLLGKYQSGPGLLGLFHDDLPKLLDDIQTQNISKNNNPIETARILLSEDQ